MSLNENSSREEIINYIKAHPYHFLHYFSDKPWARPYIDEAAKIYAKERPLTFLHYFSQKPWAQPYLDEAAKVIAKKDPEYFLKKLADVFPHYINLTLFALGGKNVSK